MSVLDNCICCLSPSPCQTFHQDVVAHVSDVEDVKSNGGELIATQPAVKPRVQTATGTSSILHYIHFSSQEHILLNVSNNRMRLFLHLFI